MWCYHQFMELNWWSLVNGNRLKVPPWVVLLAAPRLNDKVLLITLLHTPDQNMYGAPIHVQC